MPRSAARTFKATLVSDDRNLGWTVLHIPIDLKKAWPGWTTRRVHGTINGFKFSNALFAGKGGKGYMLPMSKKILTGARLRSGDTITVTLEPDMVPISDFTLPPELAAELKGDRKLRKWFDTLPPSVGKSICFWIDQAKGSATRKRRAEQMAERLYLTMEGERETPPIFRAAFAEQPLAETGWKAMTPIQRRNHLFGVFYYQTVRGREKRVNQLIEEALRLAQKRRGISDLP